MDAEHGFIETLIISETWWKCIFRQAHHAWRLHNTHLEPLRSFAERSGRAINHWERKQNESRAVEVPAVRP